MSDRLARSTVAASVSSSNQSDRARRSEGVAWLHGLRLSAAWQGIVRSQRTTQVVLQVPPAVVLNTSASASGSLVRSSTGTAETKIAGVVLRTQANGVFHRKTVRLKSASQRLALPVEALDGEKLRAVVTPLDVAGNRLNGRALDLEIGVDRVSMTVPVVADIRAQPVGANFEYRWLLLNPSDLPEWLGAYETVDVLIIGEDEARVLNATQREALSMYVGTCGRVITDMSDRALRNALGSNAVCGGRMHRQLGKVDAGDSRNEAGALVDALLGETIATPTLVKPFSGPVLSRSGPTLQPFLVVFFGVYVALVGLAMLSRHADWLALAVAGVGALSGYALLSTNAVRVTTTGWFEQTVGDAGASGVVTYALEGLGSRPAEVVFPNVGNLRCDDLATTHRELNQRDNSDSMNDGDRPVLDWSFPEPHLKVTVPLGSTQRCSASVVAASVSPYIGFREPDEISSVRNALPFVKNTWKRPLEDATLIWNDTPFAVPGLEPGKVWLADEPDTWRSTTESRWIRQRSMGLETALVIRDALPDRFDHGHVLFVVGRGS